jgi:hypothetical protein
MPNPYKPKTFLEYRTAAQNWLISHASRLTNFNPSSRAGTIIDAFSWILSVSDIEVLNGFRSAIVEGLYNTFGFGRLPGQKSTGFVRIEHSGHTAPIVIPVFEIDIFGVRFETLNSVILNVGDTFVEVDCRALEPGTEGNIKIAEIDTADGKGTISINLPSNTRVWNPSVFVNGTNGETNERRLVRFQNFIRSLGRSTLLGIKTAVESIPGVVGVVVQENINPITTYPEAGWISIFVSDGTSSPPPTLIDEITRVVKGDPNDYANYPGYAAAGTLLYISGINIQPVNISYELVVQAGSLLNDTITVSNPIPESILIANNAATTYVNTLPLGQDVLYDQLKATILKAHPDFLKLNLILPSTDFVVPNTSLARVGGTYGGSINGVLLPREVPA